MTLKEFAQLYGVSIRTIHRRPDLKALWDEIDPNKNRERFTYRLEARRRAFKEAIEQITQAMSECTS